MPRQKHPMGDGFQFLDILVFAMVAGFLLLRLRRVLGRRNGHEQPRPDAHQDGESESESETVVSLPDRGASRAKATANDGADEGARTGTSGLSQIEDSDPAFDSESFLEGARAALEIILGAFAAGDKRQLKSLLSEAVYKGFAAEIDRRAMAGERMQTTLVSIILADIVGAEIRGRRASITVKLVSEQVNVTTDSDNDVISGDPGQVETITDVWTFARDVRSRDPNWQLVETRSED
ncbi:MAG: Tim44/TimA family putative adaptor protein [Alphaproteobacteria bacterium]|nr:Tim44/TimA family putative adaptor protein [Alphaproteobacteria bacterium]